jgi:hypothetical protein
MATALFMPGNYESYWRIVQPVKQRQYHAARITEHRIDTLLNKRIDYYLSTCFKRELAG